MQQLIVKTGPGPSLPEQACVVQHMEHLQAILLHNEDPDDSPGVAHDLLEYIIQFHQQLGDTSTSSPQSDDAAAQSDATPNPAALINMMAKHKNDTHNVSSTNILNTVSQCSQFTVWPYHLSY